jgi:NTP pyrophosphatase (non-canonical NTP hydrolase)
MPETMTKSVQAMAAEVLEWCHSKGWYDTPVSFSEAMALLHSEVAEATEAWRVWGLRDATATFVPGSVGAMDAVLQPPKPEGVGSEFADILIRMLDDDARFGAELGVLVPDYRWVIHDSFLENMNALHDAISHVSYLAGVPETTWRQAFTAVFDLLRLCCEKYGIDLEAEYERKMEYNRTRPYRHGNKRQ